MQKLGVITQITDDKAVVMLGKAETCGNCGCGALTRKNGEMCEDDKHYITVKNSIGAQLGDPVNVEFQSAKMLSTSLILYLVPLLMMVAGILIANQIQGDNANDLISFVAGIASLLVSYLILSRVDKRQEKEELITISEFKGF